MEKEGYVSLWLGNVTSEGELEGLLEWSYDNEDGEGISAFAAAFGIDWFDEDFREAEYRGEGATQNLEMLLQGFSYDDVIIPRFKEVIGRPLTGDINAVVLLYNFYYDGSMSETKVGRSTFNFCGSIQYQ